MGRSPVLATVSVTVLRPALSSMSPGLVRISPGIMEASSDRLVYGHELCSVRECRFDLDFRDHFGDAVHHLVAPDHVGDGLHQFGDGLAVPRAFHDKIA